MAQTTADWLEVQADRSMARQRGQVDTAKLLSTFSAATAATLVATALQVGPPNKLDLWAAILLAAAFVAVLAVILCDRISEANEAEVLRLSHVYSWTESQTLKELRAATLTAVENNSGVVAQIRWATTVQIGISIAASVVAGVSLLAQTALVGVAS